MFETAKNRNLIQHWKQSRVWALGGIYSNCNSAFSNQNFDGPIHSIVTKGRGAYETSYPGVTYKQEQMSAAAGYQQSYCQLIRKKAADIRGKRQGFSKHSVKYPATEFLVRRLS